MAVHRSDFPLRGEHSLPEGHLTVARCRRCGIVIGYGDRCDYCRERPGEHTDEPGEYVGRHHSEWIGTVDELTIQGQDDEVELLLRKLIDAAEAEAYLTGLRPPEGYYNRLERLARRRNDNSFAASTRARYEQICASLKPDAGRRAG
jgi:hypothetical protein